MLPAFKPGNHVLTFNWTKLKAGQVIVFKKEKKCFIKRILEIKADQYQVIGDNYQKSQITNVAEGQIVGKVIWKYQDEV